MQQQIRLRGLADTIGFAHMQSQMEMVMERIEAEQGETIRRVHQEKSVSAGDRWRMAIAPHDDYTYVGYMYPLVLKNIRARTVIIFGVAHKARQLGLEDHLLFDSFTHWQGPYGDIPVSPLREKIIGRLPSDIYQVNDEMQSIEHSVEAKLPFLQYYNPEVQIVPILVPFMSHRRMNELAKPLAEAIAGVMTEEDLNWGRDVALLSSTDAVHYGDDEWGGKNFAFYGADAGGYAKAVEHEHRIMHDCLGDELSPEKIRLFTEYTVDGNDHREYRWTWCGRYSVPLGLLTSWHLQQHLSAEPLAGTLLGYATSIDHPHIRVDDLEGMGVTAPANIRHWVGYAAVGYR
jgi:AmmeMemoRadiSam system protein B